MFACIYVPNFPVAAVLRAEPELRSQAVAILEGKPPLEKILAVNQQAARLDIAPGTTKAQAELCPQLALRVRSPLQESAAHAALLDCAQSFSPCVEDSACDTVLLDLAGMESLFGPLSQIAHAIFDRAANLGLAVNVAAASNPDAAVLVARGFSGVTVIPDGQEAEQLGSLPVEVLFADEREAEEKKEAEQLLETLDRWGIRTLRALATLPEVELSERLGQKGLRLQRLAQGTVSRTLVLVEEPLVFEEAVELEDSIVLLEPLAFLLNRLLEQLCARLAVHALATQELRLTLELENYSLFHQQSALNNQQFFQESEMENRQSEIGPRAQKFCRTMRLPVPMLDAKLFLKLLQLDLNAHPPGAPIVKIHLAAKPARPRSAQGGLFLPPLPEPEKLELTLARISGMVGENRVGAVELLDTHHPEAFRMRRFSATSVPENKPQKISTPEKEEEKSAVTALRRFRPPLRADVTFAQGQPTRVVCAQKKEMQGDVLWKAGPWRSSGDWWEREAWARDEWDVALQNSGSIILCRLVHDLLGGGWFVEGVYD
jgi:protein ImuB